MVRTAPRPGPPGLARLAVAGVLVLLCAGIGAALGSAVLGGRTTAEARLIVGDQTIRAQTVPGYALATQQLAASYARLATADAVAEHAPPGAEVSASPVPDSAVVRVEAVADDPQKAVAAADAASVALVDMVKDLTSGGASHEEALKGWEQARQRLRAAEAAVAEETSAAGRARAGDVVEFRRLEVEALAEAHREAVKASASGSASLAVTQQAAVTSTNTPRAATLGAFAGAVLAALILGVAWLVRARRRP